MEANRHDSLWIFYSVDILTVRVADSIGLYFVVKMIFKYPVDINNYYYGV